MLNETKNFSHFAEYAIAFLGSVEGGLIATTINPAYTSEEISRQILNCEPKAVICMAEHVDVIKKACTLAKQTGVKLIIIQNDQNGSRPSDTIAFNELMNTDGENARNKKNDVIYFNSCFHLFVDAFQV